MKRAVKSLVTLVAAILLVFITACVPAPGEIAPAPIPTPETAPAPESTPASSPAPESEPAPSSPVDRGTIEVRATDPPPADVAHAVVYLSGVEVHYVSGNATEWITIVDAPPSFDLMEVLDGVEEILGSADVAAGKYTQIRMEVDRVEVVTTAGDSYTAEIPSGTLKIVRPFTVEPGGTTILTLDFDGEKSLILTGKGKALFKPVVKLLIEHEEGEQAQEREEEREQEREEEHEGEEASALEAIEKAEAELAEILAQLELDGITLPADFFDGLNALLAEAKNALADVDYEEAERLAEEAAQALSDIAEEISDLIEELEGEGGEGEEE